jgi:prophage DNA circulation protein
MDNNIEVLLTMRDEASPTMNAFNQTVAATKTSVGGLGGTTANMGGLKETLLSNKNAMRELGFGAMFLGSAMLGMGVSMQQSNSQTVKSAGNMLALVGGIMTAVASSVQFVSAIAKMTSALNKMNIAQLIANALSGPGGWAKIAIGVGIVGAAAYGISKATSAVSSKEERAQNVVHNHIAGSVVTQNEIVDITQRGLIQKGGRQYSAGIR